MTNKNKTVLYVSATDKLETRMIQHKTKYFPKSFTAKYNCDRLIYFEKFDTVSDAFARETQLKAGNRARKEKLINNLNPDWKDLAKDWFDQN